MARGSSAFLAGALEVIFPGRCLGCGRWMLGEEDPSIPACAACRADLQPISGPRCLTCGMPLLVEEGVCTRCRPSPYAFASHVSVYRYAGTLKELLVACKAGGHGRLAPLFAAALSALLARRHPGLPVVPVPPRPGREGPDAVELICRALEERHTVARTLRRLPGPAQKGLPLEQRRTNLLNRLAVVAAVPPELVVLDDVFTTGATVDACARLLLASGASRVHAVSLAID